MDCDSLVYKRHGDRLCLAKGTLNEDPIRKKKKAKTVTLDTPLMPFPSSNWTRIGFISDTYGISR